MKNSTKLRIILSFVFTCLVVFGFSQRRFVVIDSTNNTTIYDDINDVKSNLQDNDQVYIPGGSFSIGQWDINKSNITIIGAGHNLDSTAATERTYLGGSIRVFKNNVTLKGFYLTGNLHAQLSSYFHVSFCNVDALNLYSMIIQTTVEQNVIRNQLQGNNAMGNISIRNNHVGGKVSHFNGSNIIFENNIFYRLGVSPANDNLTLHNINNVTFTKNVFRNDIDINGSTLIASGSQNNNFYENAFQGSTSPMAAIIVDNYLNTFYDSQPAVTFMGGTLPTSYDYNFNYETPSVFDYGVYWGIGYTDIPDNPHIETATIPKNVDGNGNLNIIIDVSARN